MDPLPSAVNIPAGASSATVSVAALQDATPEEPEPLRVQLGAGPFLVGNPDSAQVLVVGPATQTSLTSAANPALLDAPVTLGVVVAGTGTVTGSVALMLDGNFLARAYLVDGHASFTVAPGTLGRGSFLFTAEYGGGVDQAPSSASLTQYVDVATVVTLAASESAPAVGQPVTFTAAVADAGRVAMGTIQFLDGTRTLASVPLSGGVATWTTQELAPGTHSLKARHSTAENPQLGESQPVTVAVGVLPTTTTLAASRATATTFEPVSLLATVASTGPAAEGLVTFKAGITTLGYATLSSGAAALTMTLPQGTLAVVAEYAGSTTHAASTSTAVTVEVSTAQLVAPASETSKSACGCTSSAEGVPASAWLALLLLGIPLRRRR
jgi:MYXO-CTERM domain-containing protein